MRIKTLFEIIIYAPISYQISTTKKRESPYRYRHSHHSNYYFYSVQY